MITWRRTRLAPITLLAMAVAVWAPPAQADDGGSLARAKPAAKLPDLVPEDGRFRGLPYSYIGEHLGHKLEYTTTNKGDKRAGPTVTKVYLQHGDSRFKLDARPVPGLDAGFQHSPPAENLTNRNRWPAGAYEVVLCVDVTNAERESNERNNCERIKKDFGRFYSVWYQYVGTANGTGPGHVFDPSVREQWNAQGIGFILRDQNKGVFTYTPDAGGTVIYQVGGTTSTNCTFTGSGVLSLAAYPNSFIRVDWNQENYGGTVTPFGNYPILSDCDPENPGQGPMTGFVFQTGILLGTPMPLPFGSRSLQGTYADPLALDTTNYSWNLAGG